MKFTKIMKLLSFITLRTVEVRTQDPPSNPNPLTPKARILCRVPSSAQLSIQSVAFMFLERELHWYVESFYEQDPFPNCRFLILLNLLNKNEDPGYAFESKS